MTLPEISADWLLARVREDEGGHLIWAGFEQRGHPKAQLQDRKLQPGEPRPGPFNVRRAVWKAMHGREPRSDCDVVAGCRVYCCVAPECMVQLDRSTRRSEVRIGARLSVTHREAIARARREQEGKLSIEQVHLVRSERAKPSDERPTQHELAAELGVSQTTIYDIERGVTWRDYRNPFEALLG